jgi:RimJ/RimL family protein N-acetyltransferase
MDAVNVVALRDGVVLRQPIPEIDGPIIDAWYSEDPTGAWNVFLERPTRPQHEALTAALDAPEYRYWVIDVGSPIGLVRLSTRDRAPGHAALLYYVARAHRAAGHGTTAVQMVIRHAFSDLGFDVLFADVLLTNKPSARLLEKLGFERTGDRKLAKSDEGPEQLEEWRLSRPVARETPPQET